MEGLVTPQLNTVAGTAQASSTSLPVPAEDAWGLTAADDGNRSSGGSGGGRWASDVDTTWLSQQTKGYSGADLSSLVRNAAMVALREEEEEGGQARGYERTVPGGGSNTGGSSGRGVLVLARRHFEAALANTQPSSGPEAVARHETWARQWHVS